jgi:hypothetical protein
MITLHLSPDNILAVGLAVAVILMFLVRVWPEKKPVEKTKAHSPKEIEKIKKEMKRLEKMLKDSKQIIVQ